MRERIPLQVQEGNKTYLFVVLTVSIVSMSFGILIGLFVWHEFSYDRYHEHADRIFRVVSEWKITDGSLKMATSYAELAPAIRDRFPRVQSAARIALASKRLLFKYDDRHCSTSSRFRWLPAIGVPH